MDISLLRKSLEQIVETIKYQIIEESIVNKMCSLFLFSIDSCLNES